MVLRNSSEIFSPLQSLSSMTVWMSLSHKALYRWPVNLWRVSLPLKLKKTSYSHWLVEEEVEVIGVYIRVEDWEGQRCDKMGIIRNEWTHGKKKKKLSFLLLEVKGGGCVAASISRLWHHLSMRWRQRTNPTTTKSTIIISMFFWNSQCSNPMSFLFDFWTDIFKVRPTKICKRLVQCTYPTPRHEALCEFPTKNAFLGTSFRS